MEGLWYEGWWFRIHALVNRRVKLPEEDGRKGVGPVCISDGCDERVPLLLPKTEQRNLVGGKEPNSGTGKSTRKGLNPRTICWTCRKGNGKKVDRCQGASGKDELANLNLNTFTEMLLKLQHDESLKVNMVSDSLKVGLFKEVITTYNHLLIEPLLRLG